MANPYFHVVDTAGNQLPYISEQDELYINENEVRLLKLVNAEVDYKSQSLQLPGAPMLLDGQENGNYTIDLATDHRHALRVRQRDLRGHGEAQGVR